MNTYTIGKAPNEVMLDVFGGECKSDKIVRARPPTLNACTPNTSTGVLGVAGGERDSEVETGGNEA